MGFRNPLTSAEAVDTGDARGGARMYATGGDYPGGVVELYDSFGQKATFSAAHTVYNQHPDGSYQAMGASTTVQGMDSNAVTAPRVQLDVREAPAGGYEPVGSLAGAARWEVDATLVRTGVDARGVRITTFASGWGRWNNEAGYEDLTFSRKPDGTVVVTGVVRYVGGAGASVIITPVVGPYVPKAGHVILSANVGDVPRFVDVRNGDLRLRGALPTGNFVSIAGEYRGQDW